MKMYTIQVLSGKEKQVFNELTKKGISAFVPSSLLHIRKGGKWTLEEKTIIPGYVFLKVDLNEKNYYTIKSINSVISFLGKNKPASLSDTEIQFIEFVSNNGKPLPVAQYNPSIGVVFNNKVLKNSYILETSKRQRRIKVLFNLYGVEHIITLSSEFS